MTHLRSVFIAGGGSLLFAAGLWLSPPTDMTAWLAARPAHLDALRRACATDPLVIITGRCEVAEAAMRLRRARERALAAAPRR